MHGAFFTAQWGCRVAVERWRRINLISSPVEWNSFALCLRFRFSLDERARFELEQTFSLASKVVNSNSFLEKHFKHALQRFHFHSWLCRRRFPSEKSLAASPSEHADGLHLWLFFSPFEHYIAHFHQFCRCSMCCIPNKFRLKSSAFGWECEATQDGSGTSSHITMSYSAFFMFTLLEAHKHSTKIKLANDGEKINAWVAVERQPAPKMGIFWLAKTSW